MILLTVLSAISLPPWDKFAANLRVDVMVGVVIGAPENRVVAVVGVTQHKSRTVPLLVVVSSQPVVCRERALAVVDSLGLI